LLDFNGVLENSSLTAHAGHPNRNSCSGRV